MHHALSAERAPRIARYGWIAGAHGRACACLACPPRLKVPVKKVGSLPLETHGSECNAAGRAQSDQGARAGPAKSRSEARACGFVSQPLAAPNQFAQDSRVPLACVWCASHSNSDEHRSTSNDLRASGRRGGVAEKAPCSRAPPRAARMPARGAWPRCGRAAHLSMREKDTRRFGSYQIERLNRGDSLIATKPSV